MTCIESHEAHPLVVVGTARGCVITLDVTDHLNILVLSKYNLTSRRISHLKVLPNSNYFFAIDDQNYLYLLKRELNSNDGTDDNDDGIKKIMSLSSGYIDYSAIEMNDGSLGILLLILRNDPNEMNSKEISNCFCEYIEIRTASNYCHQMQTILLNVSYNAMQFKYYDTNRFVLAAKAADIHLFEVNPCEYGKIEMNLLKTITTSHTIGCSIRFTVNAASILTYGNDGRCLLWDKNSMRMVTSVLTHNKCWRGVKDVVLDSMQR